MGPDLLMTSMDADGDGLLSNTEVWTWANDRRRGAATGPGGT
ncbi:MAG: hypothetical protein CM15mP128_0500 [Methanobacteriota archaeon]|nr:MAG: hypothetical protein CM15mP128_0500 [Euryarchaeota archaeon]